VTTGSVWLGEGRIGVTWSDPDRQRWAEILQFVRRIRGAEFDANHSPKCWWLPLRGQGDTIVELEDRGLEVAPEVFEVVAIKSPAVEGARLELSSALSLAEPIVVTSRHGRTLHPFQEAGVQYLLQAKGCLLGDPVGLGKTVQALAAAKLADVWPVLVVCPASLRPTWRQEVREWLPGHTVAVVAKREGWIPNADVVITSYALAPRLDLGCRDWQTVIVDECHYLKNPESKRSHAIAPLAYKAKYVWGLSATPVQNRSEELRNLLDLTGWIDTFGGWDGFEQRYCRVVWMPITVKTKQGKTFEKKIKKYVGVKHGRELHQRLRANCYVRRDKTAVLGQLPPIQRYQVPLKINNRAEYRRVEEEFIRWLRDRILSDPEVIRVADQLEGLERSEYLARVVAERVERALRAEALVHIGALRQTAAIGLAYNGSAWVEELLSGGEKVIVFAHHREVQSALAERFPLAAHLTAGGGVEEAARQFQDPHGPQLMVASLKAGGLGLTLTEAQHVVHAELSWTPADHDQAEGRAYGRLNDPHGITSWYWLAEGTVYQEMWELIESKRRAVDMVTDGVQGCGAVVTVGEIAGRIAARLAEKEA